MAITQLLIYNEALRLLGLRKLTGLTEDRKPRHVLDDAFGYDFTKSCLEIVKPSFAKTTISTATSSTVASSTTPFAYKHTIPATTLSVVGVYVDADKENPIERYVIEAGYLYCDLDDVYLTSISDYYHDQYSDWSPSFSNFVAAQLAAQVAMDLAPRRVEYINGRVADTLKVAVEVDGAQEPTGRSKSPSQTLDADWLTVYNEALLILGLDEITDITADDDRRSKLDRVRGTDLVKSLLINIKPSFAAYTTKLTSTTSTAYRLDYLHSLPSDYLVTLGLYADADLDDEVERFFVEAGSLYSDHATVYLRYIEGSTYALTPGNWTPYFSKAVAAQMALSVAPALAPDQLEMVVEYRKMMLEEAKAEARQIEPAKRPITPTVTLTNEWRRLYNDALSILGMEPLASNDADAHRKVMIDRVLDARLVESLLEDVSWQFSITSDKIDYNSSIEPAWGYQYAFDKPTDYLRLEGIYADEYFRSPITSYHDEDTYLLCDYQTIYVQYVSSDYLTNPNTWPAFFARLVAARMAKDAAGSIAGSDVRRADDEYLRRFNNATTNDAIQSPPRKIREGSWVKARGRGINSRNRPGDW